MKKSRPKASRPGSVARSAGIVSLAVMTSRVLGLVREMIFAYFFGASKSFAYDAYVIAFRIPNMLRDLFAEGALSSAFASVFSNCSIKCGRAYGVVIGGLCKSRDNNQPGFPDS